MYKGIAASPGYAAERAFVLKEQALSIPQETITADQVELEKQKVRDGLEQVKQELAVTREDVRERFGEEECAIFDSHLMMLEDPTLLEEIDREILDSAKNAVWAAHDVLTTHASVFEAMDDAYLRERAADFKDLRGKLARRLLGVGDVSLETLDRPVILVAHDLTPSQTARLNPKWVKGILTEIGGPTSHSAILARTLQIPAVVGCGPIACEITDDTILALNGNTGEITIHPEQELVDLYHREQLAFQEEQTRLRAAAFETVYTADGKRIEIAGNIGNPADSRSVLANGGDGVGLFRSEFLFLEREQMPSEEEQFEAYAEAAREMAGRPVIIRTMDIGGDKQLPYLPMEAEENPFLGFRAIRLCLAEKEMFLTQLRAILRASSHGKIRVMFPMIATEEELLEAKSMLAQAKEQLRERQLPFDEKIETGIMIEVPSAAIIADQLAPHVDFFSIGSNDLIQYTFAADRMNQKVSYLYNPVHPAILRLIGRVVQDAHAHGKWVGVCGEMAGDPLYAKELIALGVDELSMTPSLIPRMKQAIKGMSTTTLIYQ
ncbi:phosphoenolpyruvate--protein phosphotransferase [Brevibacillus nitrificans]|uniref:Phosphoenolpyruvate-protein phosphotransferase n=1 Tax=Brevibacillus nitrificans TaxID=651560 RepID=A0A3M8DKU7_9BACL|nr:phosphoenolpyruvate--protein phosphotransferase [Brevibacillus nitrificans]RNB88666.1 phosphoenolpyruvate--protein phosphotransferase [Brevibacillus nitrificans]